MEKECIVCGTKFEAKRDDARFDSQACQKKFRRNPELFAGIAPDLELADEAPAKPFLFKTPSNNSEGGWNEKDYRTANAWYDVPLAAVVKVYDGDPEQGILNGREYFLWRANDFCTNEKDEPVILNPFPKYQRIDFVPGGAASRHWGA